ncbi:MAG: hypothetical protein KJZ75_01710 [Hyphomonadaceae bacterium]|nr:hypothetical protein [Hyphomonadaceae bacterium]GIK50022.1 MAG: hypothetical protein BroJett013_27190 [Alphaproteobacteria bacterium]
MSEKKDLKRAAQAVWTQVKALRAERGKLYSAADLEASSVALAACASELKHIARQKSALSAMPPAPKPAAKKSAKRAEG